MQPCVHAVGEWQREGYPSGGSAIAALFELSIDENRASPGALSWIPPWRESRVYCARLRPVKNVIRSRRAVPCRAMPCVCVTRVHIRVGGLTNLRYAGDSAERDCRDGEMSYRWYAVTKMHRAGETFHQVKSEIIAKRCLWCARRCDHIEIYHRIARYFATAPILFWHV